MTITLYENVLRLNALYVWQGAFGCSSRFVCKCAVLFGTIVKGHPVVYRWELY